ncbi:MAG: hypothetical protein HY564_00335 [Candidatus Jacksonbacteria bacterium]|nr:hypothetical protein [Candidatus Jacksonbacteria bacterium]
MTKITFYKLTTYTLMLAFLATALYTSKMFIFKQKSVFSASDFGDSIDIFSNYTSWQKSPSKKTGDTTSQTLYLLARSVVYKQNFDSEQTYQSVTPQSIIDINGDGLADIVYHSREFKNGGYDILYSAILLNKGSMTYELSYKCVHDATGWYGDCAG